MSTLPACWGWFATSVQWSHSFSRSHIVLFGSLCPEPSLSVRGVEGEGLTSINLKFSHTDLSILSHLLIESLIYLRMAPGYSSHVLGYNPMPLHCFCCSNSFSFGDWKLFQLAPVSLGYVPTDVCMCVCTCVCTCVCMCVHMCLGCLFIFTSLVPELVISPGALGPLLEGDVRNSS